MSRAISRCRPLNASNARLNASMRPRSVSSTPSGLSAKTASPSSSWISRGGASASITPPSSTPVTSAPCSSSVFVTKAVKPEISARTRNPDWRRSACPICPSFIAETPRSTPREKGEGLELVDEIDELAKAPERAVVERKDEPRELRELVELSGNRPRFEPRRALEDVGELVLNLGELRGLQRSVQPEDQVIADNPRRVIDAVEAGHLADCLFRRVDDPEQRGVLGVDEASLDEGAGDPAVPDSPVRLRPSLHEDDRHQRRLARLHQREELERLAHRPEATREERHTACFFDEKELAGEEILEGDQLGVRGDPRIRFLLEGQANVQPEALLPRRPFLRGTHDPGAGTRNDHPARLGHPPAEEPRTVGRLLARGGPGRAEDRHLADAGVGREHLVGVAQLFERRVGDLEIAGPGPVLVQLEGGRQELLIVPATLDRHVLGIEGLGDQAVGGVVLELVTAGLGHDSEYTVTGRRVRTR